MVCVLRLTAIAFALTGAFILLLLQGLLLLHLCGSSWPDHLLFPALAQAFIGVLLQVLLWLYLLLGSSRP